MTNELEMNRLRHKILTMLTFEERMYIQPLLDKCLMFANGESRPQGEWIRQGKGNDCRCSECGCSAMYFSQLDEDEQEVFGTLTTDWCPWCGADMRKETKNEDS